MRRTDHLLRDTETIASSQHKNVLLIFSASWCGSCHSLESFLADPVMRPLFDRNFVRLVLDDGEHSDDTRHHNTIGADHLRVSFHGTDAGLPFIVMLDRSGKAHRGFSSPRMVREITTATSATRRLQPRSIGSWRCCAAPRLRSPRTNARRSRTGYCSTVASANRTSTETVNLTSPAPLQRRSLRAFHA